MKPTRFLLPVSWIYEAGMAVRNSLYDRGIFETVRVEIPVISVGNITTGGTGKTPFVEYLLRILLKSGRKAAVISRGYGRAGKRPVVVGANDPDRGTIRTLGDELSQIARKFPGVTVIADSNRVRAANLAQKKFGADIILLDDAFQHRAIARNLDIVLIDLTKPLVKEPVLPAGMRRESVRALDRAGLVVYTRADQVRHPEFKSVQSANSGIFVRFVPTAIRMLNHPESVALPAGKYEGRRVLAFCGIGNPDAFFATLRRLKFDLVETSVFPDHHQFVSSEIESLQERAGVLNALLITTEKDAMRLEGIAATPATVDPLKGAVHYLEICADVTEGEGLLLEKITNLFY